MPTICLGLFNGDGKLELCTVEGAREACTEPGNVYSAECTVDGQYERGKGHSARAAAIVAGAMIVMVGCATVCIIRYSVQTS